MNLPDKPVLIDDLVLVVVLLTASVMFTTFTLFIFAALFTGGCA